MPRIPFFARLPKATVREIKRRAKYNKVSEARIVEDCVMVASAMVSGGPRRKARGAK